MTRDITLWDTINSYAESLPNNTLLSIDGKELSFKEARDQAIALALRLQDLSVKKGEYVPLILPNSLEWYLSFLAITAIGAIPVPLDPQIGSWELNQIQNQIQAKLLIMCPIFRAAKHVKSIETVSKAFENWIYTGEILSDTTGIPFNSLTETTTESLQTEYSETFMLASTSGTTGNPKIIEVAQHSFLSSQLDMANLLAISDKDFMLLGMPLYHQGGFGMGIQATLKGASLIYQEKFSPELFLQAIEEKRVTIIQLTPTVAKLLLSVPNFKDYDISSLRLAYFAGESLSADLAKEFWDSLGIRVVNIVGSTETGTMVAWDSLTDSSFSPSHLKALPFTEFQIINPDSNNCGEVLIHTDCILTGYFNNPTESNQKIIVDDSGKKWFKTGDMGRQIDDNTIEYKGRLKNIIKRGANLIYPDELQDFYMQYPQIKDIYITGETDAVFGEKIIAYIVPHEMENPPTRGDILRFSRGSIAAYKIPDDITIIPSIPLNKGKVDVQILKQHKEHSSEVC